MCNLTLSNKHHSNSHTFPKKEKKRKFLYFFCTDYNNDVNWQLINYGLQNMSNQIKSIHVEDIIMIFKK